MGLFDRLFGTRGKPVTGNCSKSGNFRTEALDNQDLSASEGDKRESNRTAQ